MIDFMPITPDTIKGMKVDLKDAMQDCLKKMDEARSDKGKVMFSIEFFNDKVPITTEKDYRDATVTKIRWKGVSNVPLKEVFEGEFGGDYELTQDTGRYGLKSISGQTSMFDDEDEDDLDEEDEEGK